ncbi:MAG TPA: DNA-formamidopyrimidine glycosylase family protein [Candidatus Limnocylindrales bacterium]|nr:DNA-formamidopyrimidine glycosylase family protein [Candidatus Limnocylindrales bacterium]
MPEGDTLARIANSLRPVLLDKRIEAARGRPGGADLSRVVGHIVTNVQARGKHLLIAFDNDLTLHTHLGLHGSWHRYRRGQIWRRAVTRTGAVLETDEWVAACFDAPTVELIETRAVAIHPGIRDLGTDLASDEFDPDAALAGLRDASRRTLAVGDALLDQGALAGLGNVYRSELCFIERVNPLTPVPEVTDDKLRVMAIRGAILVKQNSRGGSRVTTAAGTPSNTYVYGRTGRPCFRCRTRIQSTVTRARETSNPRRVYWCPGCQPPTSHS